MKGLNLPFGILFDPDKMLREARKEEGAEATEVIENSEDRLTLWVERDVGFDYKLDFQRRSPSEIDIFTTDPNGSGMVQQYEGKSPDEAWWEYDFFLETIDTPLKLFHGDGGEKSKDVESNEAQKDKGEIKAEIQDELDENGRFKREGVGKPWKSAATAFVHDGYEVSTTHRDEGDYDICVEPPEEEEFGLADVTEEMLSWMESELQKHDLSAKAGEIVIPKRTFAFRDGEMVAEVELVTGSRETVNYSKALDTVWAEKKGQIPQEADQLGFIVLGCAQKRSTGEPLRFAQTVATDGEDTKISAKVYQNGWVLNTNILRETKKRWDDFAKKLTEHLS